MPPLLLLLQQLRMLLLLLVRLVMQGLACCCSAHLLLPALLGSHSLSLMHLHLTLRARDPHHPSPRCSRAHVLLRCSRGRCCRGCSLWQLRLQQRQHQR